MKKRILVVDDDEGVRLTISYVLSMVGYEIMLTKNGREALDVFADYRPDLVIVDLVMPEKEGAQTIFEIKSIAPSTKIIAMSGGARLSNVNILQRARDAGADRILSKPFQLDKLTSLVERILANAPGRPELLPSSEPGKADTPG